MISSKISNGSTFEILITIQLTGLFVLNKHNCQMSKFLLIFLNYTINSGKFRRMHVIVVSQALLTKEQM